MKGGVYNYVKYISDIKTPVATPHSKSMTLQSSRRVSPTYRLRRRSNPQVRASEIGHYANMDRGTIGNTHDQSASVDEERSREARDDRKSFHSGLYAMTMPLRRGKRIEKPHNVDMDALCDVMRLLQSGDPTRPILLLAGVSTSSSTRRRTGKIESLGFLCHLGHQWNHPTH